MLICDRKTARSAVTAGGKRRSYTEFFQTFYAHPLFLAVGLGQMKQTASQLAGIRSAGKRSGFDHPPDPVVAETLRPGPILRNKQSQDRVKALVDEGSGTAIESQLGA
jgi:hypothetical protein